MKKKTLQLSLMLALCITAFTSCDYFGGGGRKYETADGVASLVSDLKSEFGKDAWYTDINFSYHKSTGTSTSATGTKDPASKKMIEKTRLKGTWKDNSEITLSLTGDAKPEDFMFTLTELGDLKKLPDMIKLAVDKIKKEKNFDVVATNITVHSPDRLKENSEKFSYLLSLQPENGGTSFSVIFDQKGDFKKIID
ncbi:hypothetical protein HHL16_24690 [Pseudoflavitalea sp. G-6-1-2]|uniref:hypothetical protein n=1 Tax=Pseudoflavitalea sp. G-6-1-2 TaxID=2728841 RepID=UPI00146D39BD|nr:hypothetical protein [Pseudoflavitalea sp. G-6-1-2]NML24099.1 hypothetical protein [Pseudoflavitalea sp. G-6-1-2]